MAVNYDLTMTGPELQETLDQVGVNTQDISELINDDAQVNLAVAPAIVFANTENAIALTATTDREATLISIAGGNIEDPIEGSGTSLTGSDTLNESEAGTITYTAAFAIRGIVKSTTKNVAVVYPILYGAGADYEAATTQATARTTPAGTYNVQVATAASYVFFLVPASMTITSATMSGFEFPLQAAAEVEIGGVAYKSYQSANTYDVGTLTIVIK